MTSADLMLILRITMALRALLVSHNVSLKEFDKLQDSLARQGKRITQKHVREAIQNARGVKVV